METDEKEAFVLTVSEVEEYGLSEGGELSESLYELLLDEVVLKRCKSRMLHILDRMDRTESEIREKLEKEWFPKSVIDRAVLAAKKGRYLDDVRYANQYAYEKSKHKSRRMIRAELEQKGMDKELIEAALKEIPEEEEEEVIARELRKKARGPLPREFAARQKLLAFAARKGFPPEKCIRVYERLLEEEVRDYQI